MPQDFKDIKYYKKSSPNYSRREMPNSSLLQSIKEDEMLKCNGVAGLWKSNVPNARYSRTLTAQALFSDSRKQKLKNPL